MMLRRFDVFAVYNYVNNLKKGMPDDKSKGEAIWLAKHVAGGKRVKVGGGALDNKKVNAAKHCACKSGDTPLFDGVPEQSESYWKNLSGVEQTDEMYDKDIVRRMGEQFYNEIFLPRIKELSGKKYVEFRDSVREELEPIWEDYNNGKIRSPETSGAESGTSFRLQV